MAMEERMIRDIIPEADPQFIASLKSLDVPAYLTPKFQEYLPRLHELYEEKREAFKRGSIEDWERALKKEEALIAQATHDV